MCASVFHLFIWFTRFEPRGGNVDAVDIRVSAKGDNALLDAQNCFLMFI